MSSLQNVSQCHSHVHDNDTPCTRNVSRKREDDEDNRSGENKRLLTFSLEDFCFNFLRKVD
jgi:hypothetical protein